MSSVVLSHVDEWVLLGELCERAPEPRAVTKMPRHDDSLEGRRVEPVIRQRGSGADRVADPHRPEAADLRDLAGTNVVPRDRGAAVEDADRGHLAVDPAADAHALARPKRAREHPDVGDPLARRAALDLEHRARGRGSRVTGRSRQQLRDARRQRIDPRAGDRRSGEHRVHERLLRLIRELSAKTSVRNGLSVDDRLDDAVVVLAEHVRQLRGERSVSAFHGLNSAPLVPALRTRPIGTIAGVSRFAIAATTRSTFAPRRSTLLTKTSVGTPEPLQRAHQDPRLRLDAFDRRDHEDRAVEHAQHALDLGDEVGMPRRVDQVDGERPDLESRDRRFDGDAPRALERERVRLSAAVVDAPELVDDAGRVEQPLCECRLTGVYMRQDPQVERCAKHAQIPSE